jgi:hypothetical protein
MLNFSMLSLNENDMPEIFQDNNDIYKYYENPNISFELLRQKLINYYFNKATDECISKHLSLIISNIGRLVIYNNYEKYYNY